MTIEIKMLIQIYSNASNSTKGDCIELLKEAIENIPNDSDLSNMYIADHEEAIGILEAMSDYDFYNMDYSDLPVDIFNPLDTADYSEGAPDYPIED